jgi:8-oxo-dGTP pyrophosphatase MutT (NUDIX family)
MPEIIRVQGVNAIPLNPEGKILLQQRDDRPDLVYAGCWTTFGGKVEDGETPDEAIKRELMEEIELELPLKLWQVRDYLVERDGQKFIVESHTYVGRIDRPASEIALNEGQALGYFALEDLDKLKIAFDFEPLFREFFTALAAGGLPLDDNS